MIGLFKRPQTNRKDNEKGMQFGCQQPLLLGGALRDSPKNGCEGDYLDARVTLQCVLANVPPSGHILRNITESGLCDFQWDFILVFQQCNYPS